MLSSVNVMYKFSIRYHGWLFIIFADDYLKLPSTTTADVNWFISWMLKENCCDSIGEDDKAPGKRFFVDKRVVKTQTNT